MILFIWQNGSIGVALFIAACVERVYTSAGPPVGNQASDQPQIGWKRCNHFFFCTGMEQERSSMSLPFLWEECV